MQYSNIFNVCMTQVDDALRGGAQFTTSASSTSLATMGAGTTQSHRRTGSTGSSATQEHHKVPDPRDLDPLLGELAIAHSRAELYMRFVRRRITVSST